MNKDEIVTLSLKLTGIYCLILLITNSSIFLGNFISVIGSRTLEGFLMAIFFSFIPFVLFLLLSYVLLFKTTNLTKKMLPLEMASESRSITSREIQALAFSIIGVWVLASTIPNLIQTLTHYSMLKANPESIMSAKLNISSKTHLIGLFIKLIIGLYLFFSSTGLVNLWHKLQGTKGMSSN